VVVNDIGTSVTGEGQDRTPGQEVVDEIKKAGGSAVLNNESVADRTTAARIVENAMDNFGRIDIVVNNAGIPRDRLFFKMSVDDWIIDVHLNGAFLCRAQLRHISRNRNQAPVFI
jgi:NAD(P)-dependent dehydrogenase (short-subunit alcohol dehydrogenase family)